MILIKKILFYPLSLIYGAIVFIRNRQFDRGNIKQIKFNKPVVVVGNLTIGGTGKTPHVEFIASHFMSRNKIALVSRGYGRSTNGFLLADNNSTATEIGDEPLQYYTKFGNQLTVAVGEKRVNAIEQLLKIDSYDLFLLDDAFQHRNLKASYYVLLTDYTRLFTEDNILPLGLLREPRKGASRADLIVVSKCPLNLSTKEQEEITRQIRKYSQSRVFFSSMIQGEVVQYSTKLILPRGSDVVVLSAIAQNDVFLAEVSSKYNVLKSFSFRDHHRFTLSEINEIANFTNEQNLSVVTTEKDFMRLSEPEFEDLTHKMSIFVAPIKVQFLTQEIEFLSLIQEGMVTVFNQEV
jgi:tetraacyldisaccharide 4'-kinase